MTKLACNLLVTGGAGFIGSNFLSHALKHNIAERIINIDALTYAGSLENIKDLATLDNHLFIHGNINDSDLVKDTFRRYQIDTVVHFAAETHVDNSITNAKEFINTNVTGTFNLLEAAKETWLKKTTKNSQSRHKFYHVSTDEVFGSLNEDEASFTEDSQYKPSSPYSASKAASDHLVNAYHRTYGLPTLIGHSSNNYGYKQHTEKLIPKIIDHCFNHKPIPLYGNGKQVRDWIHVIDHCRAITTLLEYGKLGESYNISANNEISNIVLATQICNLFDKITKANRNSTTLIRHVEDRPGHDYRYSINNHKLIRQTNWRALFNLHDTLYDMIHKKTAVYQL